MLVGGRIERFLFNGYTVQFYKVKKFWEQTVGMVTQRHGGLTATDVCTKVANLKKHVYYLKY